VPRPAIFNDPRAVDCRGDGHLTTTAYFRTTATTADLLVLYLTRDGLNLIKKNTARSWDPRGNDSRCVRCRALRGDERIECTIDVGDCASRD
jgi:hypothetical protein